MAQMATVHVAVMHYADQLAPEPNVEKDLARHDSAVRALTSLMRTYTAQLSAFKQYRSKGEQKVTVRHVFR